MVHKKNNSNKICSRLFHVVITLAVFAVLLSCKTDMHKKLVNGELFLPILYIGLVTLSIVLFFMVSCMDPGFVKESDPDIRSLEVIEDSESEVEPSQNKTSYDSISDMKLNTDEHNGGQNVQQKLLNDDAYVDMEAGRIKFNLKKSQRCGLCALERPLRARHCRECQHCVRKFDHHCPWIANCVGEKNHRWFWLFLLTEVCLMSWSIQISVSGFNSDGDSSNWLRQNVFLIIADILMAVMMFVTVSLLFIHTYMFLSNNTTWESMSRHRITYLKKLDSEDNPFNMGVCRNMYTFFCYCKPFDWHKIYDKMTQRNPEYDSSDSGIGTSTKRDNLPT